MPSWCACSYATSMSRQGPQSRRQVVRWANQKNRRLTVPGMRTEKAAGDRSAAGGNDVGAQHLEVRGRRNTLAQIIAGNAKRSGEVEEVGGPSRVAPGIMRPGCWRSQDMQHIVPGQSDHLAETGTFGGKGRRGEKACGNDNGLEHRFLQWSGRRRRFRY